MKTTAKFNAQETDRPVFSGEQIRNRPGVYKALKVDNYRIIITDNHYGVDFGRLFVAEKGTVQSAADAHFSSTKQYHEAVEPVTLTFQN